MEKVRVRLRDLGKEWEEERIRGSCEWKERIEEAARSGGKSVRVEFVDRREPRSSRRPGDQYHESQGSPAGSGFAYAACEGRRISPSS